MNEKLGFGAFESEKDIRTIKHEIISFTGEPLVTGGIHYLPEDIMRQHSIGKCTAISRVQMRQKQTGKKYSEDFQYLLQKKFIDMNWYEGSSPLSSNKVAKKYGFLPIENWTYTTEQDSFLSYSEWIKKLQAIPDEEINRLLTLCIDKIIGYAKVDISNPQAIAKAINESPNQSGILCRYGCQSNWWLPSWDAKDIEPLRYAPETSGHQVIDSFFDYSKVSMLEIANTWGILWARKGLCFIDWNTYPMTEAWVDLLTEPEIIYPILKIGSTGDYVIILQRKLNNKLKINLTIDGVFGKKTLKAVTDFQLYNALVADGIVGKNTWNKLNN